MENKLYKLKIKIIKSKSKLKLKLKIFKKIKRNFKRY